MAQVINEMDVPSHSFVFHGTGERYFLICVVNVLLTIRSEEHTSELQYSSVSRMPSSA